MKNKSIFVLLCLASIFFISWSIKIRTPINRPQNAMAENYVPWYMNSYSAPVASDEWHIDADLEPNYVPVPGKDEVYMVLDSSGKVIKYRQRQRTKDGSWLWSDYSEETAGIEEIDGKSGLYLLTDADGNQRYKKYVRNEDNTYCYVDTDEKGVPLDIGTDATNITPEYKHLNKNTYAKFNEDGVMEGYRNRVDNGDGTFHWEMGEAPSLPSVDAGFNVSIPSVAQGGQQAQSEFGGNMQNIQVIEGEPIDGEIQRIENADGTYTITERITNTEIVNGERITTETVTTKVYAANGDIMQEFPSDTQEVSREKLPASQQPENVTPASSLEGEAARVSGVVSYNDAKAQEIISYLNAERAQAGLAALSVTDEADKIARIKAGDMATYDYTDTTSPVYGSFASLCEQYGVKTNGDPAVNMIKSSQMTAQDIHMRFQSDESARSVRMAPDITTVGISVATQNGVDYIAEVFLQ